MSAATRSSWDWLQLASLGEQLRSEDSLGAQRDRIAAMANRLIAGKVDDRRGAATDLAQDAILANGFWNSAHEGSGGLHGICAGHC